VAEDNTKKPTQESMAAAQDRPIVSTAAPKKQQYAFALSPGMEDALEKAGFNPDPEEAEGPLMYAIKQASGSASSRKAPRIAFTEDPTPAASYAGMYKTKRRLLPDDVLKMIRIQDHLVAAILRARGNTMALHGHVKANRFDVGVDIDIRPEFEEEMTPEQTAKVRDRIARAQKILINCGHVEGLKDNERMGLAEFLDLQCRNGLTFGRFGTEIVYDSSEKFHRFRPVDIATIFKTLKKGEGLSGVREGSIKALEGLTGVKIDKDVFTEDGYEWIQVIDGMPRQAFTHKELIVFNLYPSTDVEHNGYPVSPMDTVASSITTHISIDIYKKLFFQNGRAAKGMLLIKSDEIDQPTLDDIKQQFNASINNVSNSFRTPIFGVGKEDDVEWLPMVGEGARDTDFQFMYDQVARNILSAFNISPDELPGYGHLSKGTNQQTLSESNNEFKLTAARDTGLRPLILKFQSFINERLMPLIDPELAQLVVVQLSGLDAMSREQESLRLAQDMPIHMHYDEVLSEVDKDPVGQYLAGNFPFNERFQVIADKYLQTGTLMSEFMGNSSAAVDPMLRYPRDPFFLQWFQLMAQINPAAVRAYMSQRPYAMDILKMFVQDDLEEEGE